MVALPALNTPVVPELDPDQPSVGPGRVANCDARISKVRDDAWPLGALRSTPGGDVVKRISFDDCPLRFVDAVKHYAYSLVNSPTPEQLLERAGSQRVRWPSVGTICARVRYAKRFVRWLDAQGIQELTAVDDDVLTDYAIHIATIVAPTTTAGTAGGHLAAVVDWAGRDDDLPPRYRIPRPPWIDLPYPLIKRQRSAENKVPRISQATMGPLLEWAVAFVMEFADDILGGFELVNRLQTAPVPSGQRKSQRVRSVFLKFEQEGRRAPGYPGMPGCLGSRYLQVVHGLADVATSNIQIIYKREFSARVELGSDHDAVLPMAVTGRLGDGLWLDSLNFYDFVQVRTSGPPRMVRLLQAAAFVVAAYLTGMRPDEARTLQQGCAPEPQTAPDGTAQYRINGTRAKRVPTNDDPTTNNQRVGAVWATIAPAVQAVRTLERLNHLTAPDPVYLFYAPEDPTSPIDVTVMNQRLREFIDFVNDTLAPRTTDPDLSRIPDDPAGPVCAIRFRRTLAWFICNQPGGRVALATQYQQVGVLTGYGYGSTQRSGLGDILTAEQRAARRQLYTEINANIERGGGVSGAAAERVIAAAQDVAGIDYLPDKEARELLDHPEHQLYNNDAALSLCLYNPRTALCERLQRADRADSPDLIGCQAGCVNRAVTDDHARAMDLRAQDRRAQAEFAPEPLRIKYLHEAEQLEDAARRHRTDRIAPPTAEPHRQPSAPRGE